MPPWSVPALTRWRGVVVDVRWAVGCGEVGEEVGEEVREDSWGEARDGWETRARLSCWWR